MVVGALHGLWVKVTRPRLLTGFKIEHSLVEVSHLQFIDDMIIFCDVAKQEVSNLKTILGWLS